MKYILFAIVMLIATITITYLSPRTPVVDKQTKALCKEASELRKAEYKGTEWEDMDFYKSCIENIAYSNPLKERTLDL